jgi:hypothetical protein
MKRLTRSFSSSLVIAVLAAGCAGAPSVSKASVEPTASPAADCNQLGADIARAEDAKRAAMEKEKNARKPIVPFVAAVHYISSKSAAAETDRQIKELRAYFTRQGCDRHGT